MKRQELIHTFLEFFKSKGHREIPNSSLVPENNPAVLFTTAGMHPLIPYLLGKKHPLGKRLVNIQKCLRTSDIEKVGDDFHLTFFEMLGSWSLGDYWKKQAIEMSFEFLDSVLKIPEEKLTISCFAGGKSIAKDEESSEIWQSLGIKKNRIKFLGIEDNFWIAGNSGPCGPCTEMFVNNCEIWNDVFMQYNKTSDGKYQELKQKNVDTGVGVERTLAILNNKSSVYETECFLSIIKKIEKLSGKKYGKDKQEIKAMRIIADHVKASCFITADNIMPSNVERGYVLRRLIRRAIRYKKELNIKESVKEIALPVFEIYPDYKHLQESKKRILDVLEAEENKFLKTLEQGERELLRLINKINKQKGKLIDGKSAFLLYQSYGFPLELITETANQYKIKVNEKEFYAEQRKHQELSRTASAGTFKSGLADSSEQVTRLHTATHLLNAALKVILKNPNIHQKGSNITAERLRFDFNFDRKLTDEEIKKIEELINKKIQEKLLVICREMTVEEAKKLNAEGIFQEKYKDKVKVYSIADFSKEICAGPHVSNTAELGKFKIIKEESNAAGVRRIKAVLE